MAKRIPKLSAPEEVHQKLKSASLADFCEVYIPMAPDVYTYGVPAGHRLTRGDVVWVQFATRKKPALAVVSKVHQDRPKFDVRPAYPHQSGYRFSERYMEMLEWTARYYISTPMKALFVFWPSDFEKYLDALAFTKGEASPSREPQGSPATPSAGSRPATPPNAPALTLEQTNAFNTLCEELNKTGFRGVLLHGVTGSGKTRVYQELAREALKQNKKVLILVPEIGLTPQTLKRFEDFLQVPIVVLHSALSAPKKREGPIHRDPRQAEGEMPLLADRQGDQVVGPGPRVGADHDGHAVGQDEAAQDQHARPSGDPRAAQQGLQQAGEHVDDRTAEDHAEGRPDLDVAPIHEEQDQDDQQADPHVGPPMGQKRPGEPLRKGAEDALHEHVEGIGPQIGQQEERDAQVRDHKSRHQDHDPQLLPPVQQALTGTTCKHPRSWVLVFLPLTYSTSGSIVYAISGI